MIIFQGETHLSNVRLGGPVTAENSSTIVWATDTFMESFELEAGVSQSVHFALVEIANDLELGGGSFFQQVTLTNVTLNSGNLIVNGTFEYGFMADAVTVRQGSANFTGLENFNLGLTVIQPTDVIFDDCHRGKVDLLCFESLQHGLRIEDSSDNRFSGQIINAGQQIDDTYDGIFVLGDSNRNRTEFTVTYTGAGNQMRYGANLSAATVDNHVEASVLTGSGATGNFNDAGTGTVLTDDHIV